MVYHTVPYVKVAQWKKHLLMYNFPTLFSYLQKQKTDSQFWTEKFKFCRMLRMIHKHFFHWVTFILHLLLRLWLYDIFPLLLIFGKMKIWKWILLCDLRKSLAPMHCARPILARCLIGVVVKNYHGRSWVVFEPCWKMTHH